MAVMCDSCFTVYKRKYRSGLWCKMEDCLGDLVEIDENYVVAISILNKKGYFTEYCCSGHPQQIDRYGGGYVSFRHGVIIPSLPDGFKLDDPKHSTNRMVIRVDIDRYDMVKRQKDILRSSASLLEWAEGLRENEQEDL